MTAFATTRWSVVLAARGASNSGTRAAMAELCSAYWEPLYTYVRRQGRSPEDAADLTQAYFARFLEKDYLRAVSPDAGRFRSFLLVSLRHFLANEWDRASAKKRAGDLTALSLDFAAAEARLDLEPRDERTPESEYERRWALALIERAAQRLRAEADGARAVELHDRLRGFLTDGADEAYRDVAAELAMTEGAVKTAVYRLRRRLGQLLREEVGQTVVDPSEVDDELRHLLGALGQ
jgi:RNA polymerase sigma-70 factor (ECF subfamily)